MKNIVKTLLTIGGSAALAACTTTVSVPPVAPTHVMGCTLNLQLPTCEPVGALPTFNEGDGADAVAIYYERLKGQNMKLMVCVNKLREAAEDFKRSCEAENEHER